MTTVREILAVGAAVVVVFVAAFIFMQEAEEPAAVPQSIDVESDAWIAEKRLERVRTMPQPQETKPPAGESSVSKVAVPRAGIPVPIPEPEFSLQLPEPQAYPLPDAGASGK